MKTKSLGLISLAMLLISSCSDKGVNVDGDGAGHIVATVSADNSVLVSTTQKRSGAEAIKPAIEDFALIVEKQDGSFSQKWSKIELYDPNTEFPTGTYTVSVSYGAANKEGFEMPYYYGSTETVVKDSETSTPAINATLANTMVSIAYTDAFKKYFSDYTATIHSTGGEYIKFEKDETRPAYVRPGEIALELDLTKTTGSSFKFQPASIENAQARTLYNVTFDVNGGEIGEAQLVVTFSSETVNEPIEIKLSDEIITAPAPIANPVGFTDGETINVLEGDAAAHQVKVDLTALSGFESVVLTTQSESLAELGWPSELDLVKATAAEQTLLENLGLKVLGLWNNPDRMAIVDFTNAVASMHVIGGKTENSFAIQVKDKYTKVSDPVTLKVSLTPLELTATKVGGMIAGTGEATVTMKYNGSEFSKKVKFSARDQYGNWVECEVKNLKNNGDGTYTFTLTLPRKTADNEVRVSYCDRVVETAKFTVPVVTTNYTIETVQSEIWTTRATIKLVPADPNLLAPLTEVANVYIKGAGEYSRTTNVKRNTENGTIEISGLAAGSNYTVKTSLINGSTDYSNEVTFTTEQAAQLPNGDFETLRQTINVPSINQGGIYSYLSGWTPRYNTTSYSVSEPTGWASVNAKTCCLSAETLNTWFVLPSTYNTSDASSGSNAMVLRNVSWDLHGTEPPRSTNTDATDYSRNTPSSIANTSAGKLFLGTYSFNATTGAEQYTEGIAFTSRPSALTGFYKYANDSQDKSETGMVKVQVLSGTTVIGEGTASLKAVASYTKFSVNIVYSNKSLKATNLKVMITSSNHASYTQSQETSAIKTTKYTEYTQMAIGAVLNVDNLKLTY